MITYKMTDSELYKEVQGDLCYVWNYVDKKRNKYERAIKQSNIFPVKFKPIEYISPKHNIYYIFLSANKKKDWKDLIVTAICIYDNGKGISAIMPLNKEDKIGIYPCHFFSRYRSRYLKDDSLSTIDVILKFFDRNKNAYGETIDDNHNMAMSCNDGVIFSTLTENDKIHINKTFIGFDMLFDSQDEYKSEYYEVLRQYNMGKLKNVN